MSTMAKTYEPYYFLNGPTWGRRISGRNQSSRFVEDQVCALLTQAAPLSRHDLTLAMAWKIGGLIDHRSSEANRKIEYLQNWHTTLTATVQYGTRDFSQSIPFLANNMNTISKQIEQGNPRYVFDLVPHSWASATFTFSLSSSLLLTASTRFMISTHILAPRQSTRFGSQVSCLL